jgi:hypothetical protein
VTVRLVLAGSLPCCICSSRRMVYHIQHISNTSQEICDELQDNSKLTLNSPYRLCISLLLFKTQLYTTSIISSSSPSLPPEM